MTRGLKRPRRAFLVVAVAILVALLVAVPLLYQRIQDESARVRIELAIDHPFRDIQLVASDRGSEPSKLCKPEADRALCSDGQGFHVLRLGPNGLHSPRILHAAYGLANAELGDVGLSRLVCYGDKQNPMDPCPFLEVSAHSSRLRTCREGAPAAEIDSHCATFWRTKEVATLGWVLEAARPGITGYVGCSGGAGGDCHLAYGSNEAEDWRFHARYDYYSNEWVAWAPDEEAQVAISADGGGNGTTHVWLEVGADLSGAANLARFDGTTLRATLYVIYSSPGP